MDVHCMNCAYWGDEHLENSYGVMFSRCRRFPPIVIPVEVARMSSDDGEAEKLGKEFLRFNFPWVADKECCGEFKKDEEGETRFC